MSLGVFFSQRMLIGKCHDATSDLGLGLRPLRNGYTPETKMTTINTT